MPAASGAPLATPARSFFSVDAPNVIITSIKKAGFAEGLIVKLLEIEGVGTATSLRSDYFRFTDAMESTILEDDLAPFPTAGLAEIPLTIAPHEILTLRLQLSTIVGGAMWIFY